MLNINSKKAPLWLLTILMVTILFRQLGFSLLSDVAIGLHTIILLLFSLLAGHYYSKSKTITKSDVLSILGIAFSSLFLLWDTISLILLTVLLLFIIPAVSKYRDNKYTRVAVRFFSILSLAPCILFLLLTLIFTGFGATSITHNLPSPDGKFLLVIEKHDAGATGGSTEVSVMRTFGGQVQWKRRLYLGRWSDEPALQWIDNHTVNINGTDCSIFFENAME
ncbi:DUF5412 family protein [Telluribacter sp. SYSU D00476]|uniref:DUF5412 family protein n=1 Tax=Telluribacter sp. SYSU D00476 TaxID=2811430 RepID=UPI001FF27FFA|nr:DUF5412 family protein [Telluribacter sp. SYSU D00476]